jgi:superfamily II DNA or RNA helicase
MRKKEEEQMRIEQRREEIRQEKLRRKKEEELARLAHQKVLEEEEKLRRKQEKIRQRAEEKRRKVELRANAMKWIQDRADYIISKRDTWDVKQGEEGFNKYANEKMHFSDLTSEFEMSCESSDTVKLMPYQVTVKFLLRPTVPIDRFLCVHRTGSGKTLSIINILDNYYHDTRPKILIFPQVTVAENFYSEIMKFPNKYRDYVLKQTGKDLLSQLDSKSKAELREARKTVKDILAMKGTIRKAGQRGYLAAPLRAYRYSNAGGSGVFKHPPTDPIFKIKYDTKSKNPYSNKLVLMDEVHNMVHLSPDVKKYKDKIENLKKALYTAQNSVIVGFTATPVITDISEGHKLLEIIKGKRMKYASDEGFVSFFNDLPPSIYPTIIPENGLGLKLIFKVEGSKPEKIKGQKMPVYNLEAYRNSIKKLKFPVGQETFSSEDLEKYRKLMNYINLSSSYSHITQSKWIDKYEIQPELYGSKINQVVDHILDDGEKSLVLIDRAFGFKAFLAAFNLKGKGKACGLYEKSELTCLNRFNDPSNLDGSKLQVIIADASIFSEGVSFFGVRKLYLMNPPLTYGLYLQQVGRALRACVYHKLPKRDRNVKIYICIGDTKGPESAASEASAAGWTPSIDKLALESIQNEKDKIDEGMDFFREISTDGDILAAYFSSYKPLKPKHSKSKASRRPRRPRRTGKSKKDCNPKSKKAKDLKYRCNGATGRWKLRSKRK